MGERGVNVDHSRVNGYKILPFGGAKTVHIVVHGGVVKA